VYLALTVIYSILFLAIIILVLISIIIFKYAYKERGKYLRILIHGGLLVVAISIGFIIGKFASPIAGGLFMAITIAFIINNFFSNSF
jgi:hypothetical protein